MIPTDVPSALLSDLAHSLDAKLDVGECQPRVRSGLARLGLPFWLENVLGFAWVRRGGYVHAGYHLDPLAKTLGRDDLPRLVGERLFPVGSAGNGDPIVIRFEGVAGRAVGMLSHEESYGCERYLDHYHQAVPTLEEFLFRLVDRMYLPRDSFAARELRVLIDTMRRDPRA